MRRAWFAPALWLAAACGRSQRAESPRVAAGPDSFVFRGQGGGAQIGQPAPVPDSAPADTTFTVPDSTPVMLFNVWAHAFEPIVIIDGNAFRKPPAGEDDDSAVVAFGRRWYDHQERYRRFHDGRLTGWVIATGLGTQGCVGMTGNAWNVPAVPPDSEERASNSASVPHALFARSTVSSADSITLLNIAASVLPDSIRGKRRFQQQEFLAVQMESGSPLLVAVLRADSAGGDPLRETAVWLLAEASGARYVVALALIDDGVAEDNPGHRFLEAFDLDADGMPEILVRNLYYESHDYSIVKRVAGRWKVVYSGGGGGC